jgi:hypothetical protein
MGRYEYRDLVIAEGYGLTLQVHRRDRIDNSLKPGRHESRLDHRPLDVIWAWEI